jgi:hypothetical protein
MCDVRVGESLFYLEGFINYSGSGGSMSLGSWIT